MNGISLSAFLPWLDEQDYNRRSSSVCSSQCTGRDGSFSRRNSVFSTTTMHRLIMQSVPVSSWLKGTPPYWIKVCIQQILFRVISFCFSKLRWIIKMTCFWCAVAMKTVVTTELKSELTDNRKLYASKHFHECIKGDFELIPIQQIYDNSQNLHR